MQGKPGGGKKENRNELVVSEYGHSGKRCKSFKRLLPFPGGKKSLNEGTGGQWKRGRRAENDGRERRLKTHFRKPFGKTSFGRKQVTDRNRKT